MATTTFIYSEQTRNLIIRSFNLESVIKTQENNNHILTVSNQTIVDIKLPFRSVLVITLKVMISIFLTSIFLFLLSLLFGTSLIAIIQNALDAF